MRNKTSHQKKMMFNALLNKELCCCKYRIDANYEWNSAEQILSFCLLNDKTLKIGINLNLGKDLQFRNNDYSYELSIKYRAYFISSYIRCLETAATSNPKSYFQGLVSLCAINSMCNKHKEKSYSPIVKNRPYELKPIDVYCATRALARVLIDSRSIISENEIQECQNIIQQLVTYSLLPEISYLKRRPIYTIMFEVKKLQRNIESNNEYVYLFPLLKEIGFDTIQDMALNSVIRDINLINHPFWVEVAMRLISYSDAKVKIVLDENNSLKEIVEEFNQNCVRYFKDIRTLNSMLTEDNYLAIKKCAELTNRTFILPYVKSGALHYYQ